MKNILSLVVFIGLVLICMGCKTDKSGDITSQVVEAKKPKTTVIDDETSVISIIKNMAKTSPSEAAELKKQAKAIIDYRYKENNRKAFILLDMDLWEYEFVFTGKTMTKPGQLFGHWIDFHEDMTYTYGQHLESTGSGIYTYSIDSGLLLMIDDNDNIKPQEYEAKLFDRTLIMDGNEIYGDNNYNAKLRRITEKPIKS